MKSNASHRLHATHLVRESCGGQRKPPILFTAIRRKLTDRFCIQGCRHLFVSFPVNKPATIEDKSFYKFIYGYQEPTQIHHHFHIHHHVRHYKYRHGRRVFRSEYSKDGVRSSRKTSGCSKGLTWHLWVKGERTELFVKNRRTWSNIWCSRSFCDHKSGGGTQQPIS